MIWDFHLLLMYHQCWPHRREKEKDTIFLAFSDVGVVGFNLETIKIASGLNQTWLCHRSQTWFLWQ